MKKGIEYLNEAKKIFEEVGAKIDLEKNQHLLDKYHLALEEPGLEQKPTGLKVLKERIELSNVYKVSQMISSILDIDELLNKIMDSVIEMTGAEHGFLMLYPDEENAKKKLQVVVSRNMDKEDIKTGVFELSESIISAVERERTPRIVVNALEDEELKKQISVVKYGLKSILCAPIMTGGVMVGIIYLDNSLVSGLFGKEDLEMLTALSAQIAISIQNARLYKKAITDGLTGLHTYNYFQQFLDRSIKAAVENKKPLCLLMLDIDLFKEFNDRYGHQIGDAVLKKISDILKGEIRKTDLIARYGGEEFVIVLPDTGIDAAKEIAEKIRVKVSGSKILFKENCELYTTISIGIAELTEDVDRLNFIESADRALYKAKRSGRNCVIA